MHLIDLCKKPLVHVTPQSSAVAIAKAMRDEHVGSVVVGESGDDGLRALGIVTDRDLALLLVARDIDPDKVTAMDIMTAPVLTSSQDKDIDTVLQRMHTHSVRRIVIEDENECAIGLISIDDITRFLAMEIARISVIGESAIEREETRLIVDSD